MTTNYLTASEIDELTYSPEYAEFIMEHSKGDRTICNGDTLLQAQEDLYLFDAFLDHMNVVEVVE